MTFQLITLVAAATAIALLGLVYTSIPVYVMLAALLSVLVVSFVASRLSTAALGWRRPAVDRVFEHEPVTVVMELTNRGRLPRLLLTVRDHLPEFVEAERPPEFVVPSLWPGERARLSYQARALKRGVYSLGPLSVSASDPFGIFRRFVPLAAHTEAVVYPRPVPLAGSVARTGTQTGLSTGERARAAESGLEFYGVRDYQPGDELRRIHWPITARHAQLTVIEYERGTSASLTVVLDTAAGTEFGTGVETTLEVGVRAAASLIRWALASQGVSTLVVGSSAGPHWVEVSQPDREYEALEVLARVKAEGTIPISKVLEWAGHRMISGGAVCAVTAAPDKGLPAVIEGLRQRQVRVSVVMMEAASFDPRAFQPAVVDALRIAGAVTATVRRGDDLREALRGVLVATY